MSFLNINKTKMMVAAMTVVFGASVFSANAALSRKPQDNLFYATSTDPLGLDPALVDDFDSGNIASNLYEGLMTFKKDNTEVVPQLAESYTVSDDGLTYTFKLRQGVKFHDGTDFNAQAVKFNFDRQMPENQVPKMSYASMVFNNVETSKVIDDYTFEVKLKKPQTQFLHNLAMSFSAPIISPTALQKYNNNVNEHPVGTGPYQFVAWDRGQQVILTRFDDYWGEKAKTANIIIRTIPETSARIVALNNGEIDVAFGLDANVIAQIEQGGNIITNTEGMNTNYMFFNVHDKQKSVVLDKEVRKALAMSVNVPELVQSLYKGYASVATTFLPTFIPGYSKNVKQVTYNPEKAKEILAKKGVTHINMISYTGARQYNPVGGQVLAEAIQGYFAKVGVKSDLQVYDWATYKNKLLTADFDVAFMGWNGDNGDPDNFLALFADDDPINNTPRWVNQEYRDLIAKGAATKEGPARNAVYEQAEMVLAEESPILPISHARQMVAYRPNIKDLLYHQVGLLFFSSTVKE